MRGERKSWKWTFERFHLIKQYHLTITSAGNTITTDGDGPAVESAAAVAAAATTCAVMVTLPTKRRSPRYDLSEFCKDTEWVKL